MNKQQLASGIGFLVILVIVVPFVVYAIPEVIGAEQSLVVYSGSMSPAISAGDVVVIDNTDPANIQEGDIITFTRSEEELPTTHRVVDVQENGDNLAFQTKGDANDNPDPQLVSESRIIGTVVITLPYIGHVIMFGSTPLGFALLLGLPFGLLVVTEIWSLAKKYKGPTQTESTPEANDSEDENGHSPENKDEGTAENKIDATRPENDNTVTDESSDKTASAEERQTSVETNSDNQTTSVDVHPSDLIGVICLLFISVPYTVYVAIQLPTGLTFSVMFANIFLSAVTGGLWLTERLAGSDHADTQQEQEPTTEHETTSDPATDGGTTQKREQ